MNAPDVQVSGEEPVLEAPAAAQDEQAGEQETATETAPETTQSGFGSLFGWRRNAENDDSADQEANKEAIVSSPDDHPEPAPFDDADLEIPAFLRRSANH